MEQLIQSTCPSAGGISAGILANSIASLLTMFCTLSEPTQWPKDMGPTVIKGQSEYDFIVIGSGSGGSAVAGRLAEIENWKVLLVEAGGLPPAESEIPSLGFSLQNKETDWAYRTEKNPKLCRSMEGEQCRWPRGRLLGGTSAINAMLYVRGNKKDYDDWKDKGNSGWDYESVLEMFKISERLHERHILNENENFHPYHGFDGKLRIEMFNKDAQMVRNLILNSWEEIGFNKTDDVNGASQMGFGRTYGNIHKGRRASSAKSYLTGAGENLHVIYNAHVTKVIIDENTKTTTGIEVKIGDKTTIIHCKKEVIISGGTINTPQILMLSGIGPEEHLKSIGIKPLVNLAVGENLQDHVFLPVIFTMNKGNGLAISSEYELQLFLAYIIYNSGPVAAIRVTDTVGFINTLDKDSTVPDIQYHHEHYLVNSQMSGLMESAGYKRELLNLLKASNKHNELLVYYVTLLKPKSRGKIVLKSKDPFEKPLIYPNYFANEEDMETMIRGIKTVERLETTKVFKSALIESFEWTPHECKSHEFKSDAYWRCMLEQTAAPAFHPVGTAKMGPVSDKEAVVDPRLKVHGVKGLRVADASIMPDIVRGNTNAPSIMIGEQAAKFIIEDWLLKPHHDSGEL